MHISLSPEMLKSIESHVQQARGSGVILDVYRAAETIRVKHIADNIALEDIIEKIVSIAGANLPMEFAVPEFAVHEESGVVGNSTAELLLPEDGTLH